MNGISTWAASAAFTFSETELSELFRIQKDEFNFSVYLAGDSLWLLANCPHTGRVAFRLAYAPGGELKLREQKEGAEDIIFRLSAAIGTFTVKLSLPQSEHITIRYTTKLTPGRDLLIPFWPRDIIIPGKDGKPENTAGQVHASQVGTRSGIVYFSLTRPKAGSVLYLQDLTSLAGYCEQVQVSCADVVGGQWPELGLLLPPAKDKPLKAGKEVIVSDAIVLFSPEVPADEASMSRQYLNLLAAAYLQLTKPKTNYQNWPDILQKGQKDLKDNTGCWAQFHGHEYFNAYVCDYLTPPEIMVQLAILIPLIEYKDWSGKDHEFIHLIREGLPTFFSKKIGTVMRWLPAAEEALQEEEEQKKPKVMDAWYLHHPLLNLSRIALQGDKTARQLFLDSIPFAMRVARHFKYSWPVFYNMESLDVVKAETQPGEGGEKDVAGIYAHVMLQAYELTKDKKYLQEAERAAKTLQGKGFDVFYQANNTAFSAGALLRLFKITKNQIYLDLSYLCLTGIFKNVHLWDCNYGYGKHFPSFFSIFPLSDAPYTAAYEEQEVFSAMHDYLDHAKDVEILPSVRLLMAEFIRYTIDRAAYYYPPMLPKEMLAEKVKTGELDPKLWIPVEDLHDGWEKSGEVGQEVYGAGISFAIVPRHYRQVPGEDFMAYADYPTEGFTCRKGGPITFKLRGDGRLSCQLMIAPTGDKPLPKFKVTVKGQKEVLEGKESNYGCMSYALKGDQAIHISWNKRKP